MVHRVPIELPTTVCLHTLPVQSGRLPDAGSVSFRSYQEE